MNIVNDLTELDIASLTINCVPHTLPFNVVAANNFASIVASGDCRMVNVVDQASGCI